MFGVLELGASEVPIASDTAESEVPMASDTAESEAPMASDINIGVAEDAPDSVPTANNHTGTSPEPLESDEPSEPPGPSPGRAHRILRERCPACFGLETWGRPLSEYVLYMGFSFVYSYFCLAEEMSNSVPMAASVTATSDLLAMAQFHTVPHISSPNRR
jgi:hypothetical protein